MTHFSVTVIRTLNREELEVYSFLSPASGSQMDLGDRYQKILSIDELTYLTNLIQNATVLGIEGLTKSSQSYHAKEKF